MAANPGSDRWNLSNWTGGTVTLFEALGIKKGTVEYPKLQTTLTSAAAAAAPSPSTSSSSDTSGGNTVAPAGSSETDWVKALLTSLGAPLTQANINSLVSWINKESPWSTSPPDGALWTNNPLNTTEPASGATSINSVGVKKYTTSKIGITATVATLIGGYPSIVSALKSGKGLCGNSSVAAALSKWSGGGYSSVC